MWNAYKSLRSQHRNSQETPQSHLPHCRHGERVRGPARRVFAGSFSPAQEWPFRIERGPPRISAASPDGSDGVLRADLILRGTREPCAAQSPWEAASLHTVMAIRYSWMVCFTMVLTIMTCCCIFGAARGRRRHCVGPASADAGPTLRRRLLLAGSAGKAVQDFTPAWRANSPFLSFPGRYWRLALPYSHDGDTTPTYGLASRYIDFIYSAELQTPDY